MCTIYALKRLPSEWQMLSNISEIRDSLKLVAGKDAEILDNEIYSYVNRTLKDTEQQRELLSAKEYLNSIEEITLTNLVEKWWKKLSHEIITRKTQSLILNFTNWIRDKQAMRRNLIPMAIAQLEGENPKLIPLEDTILAEPYVGDYRRLIFPNIPAIIPGYYKNWCAVASPPVWRSFFESGSLIPKGQLKVCFTYKTFESNSEAITDLIGRKAFLRASDLSKDWNGIEITNKYFYLIDGTIPFVKKIEKDLHKASAFLKWLEEDPSILTRSRKQSIVYIPYGSGNIQSIRIESSMSWVDDLIEENWIPANDGKCYNPKDVLLQEDTAQPDIPYTKMSENLREVLHEIDIPFGENIPTVRSLQRLKIEGPRSDRKRLIELIFDAISEINDDSSVLKELEVIVLNENLFPVPESKRAPDGLLRIPLSRIVQNTGSGRSRRSDLSGWVISMKDFESDLELQSIINRIYTLIQIDIPKTTTFEHAVSFLEWVWTAKPQAENIRSYLRSAYDYVVRDIEISNNADHWSEVLDNAMVFTSKREWSSAKSVFYDDIGKAFILKLVSNLEIATSGHLGNNHNSIKKVSELLNLKPLSERIEIRSTYSDSDSIITPTSWHSKLSAIVSLVKDYITIQGSTNIDENDEKHIEKVSFEKVQEIRRTVYDRDKLIYERQVNSDFIKDENRIVVKRRSN